MKNDILFPVRKVENPAIAQGFDVVNDREYAIIGQIDGKEKILHYCSDRYNLMPNELIFGELERLFSLNPTTSDFKSRTLNRDNVSFHREYSFPKFESFVGSKKDGIIAGMGVGNSYNGTLNFSGSVNAHRLICTNGLWGVASVMRINNRHTEIVKTAVQELFIQAMDSIQKFQEQVEKYNVLASATRSFDWEDRLETVAVKSGIPKFHDEAKAIIRAEATQMYGGVVNDWLIYNGLNQIIHNDGLNKKGADVRQKLDEKVFNYMVTTV